LIANFGLDANGTQRRLSWLMSLFVSIPDFQTLMRPVLVAPQGDEPKSLPQIREAVAESLDVSEEDRLVMLPSGKQSKFDKGGVGYFAHDSSRYSQPSAAGALHLVGAGHEGATGASGPRRHIRARAIP
jgi:hypothetical protein